MAVFTPEQRFFVNLLQVPVFQVAGLKFHVARLVAGLSGLCPDDGQANPADRPGPLFHVFLFPDGSRFQRMAAHEVIAVGPGEGYVARAHQLQRGKGFLIT